MMRKPLALLATAGALSLGVAACGGSSHSASASANSGASTSAASSTAAAPAGSSSTAAAAAGSTQGASRIAISAAKSGALMFSTDTLHAKAGTVMITFTNASPEDHNLTLVHGANGSTVGATPTFSGGAKTLTVHLTKGSYTYYCSVPGHRQGGMQGTLTVS